MALLDAAKFVSMLVSLYMRLLNNWHCACPMLWLPDSTIRSRVFNPLAANMEISVGRSENGEGISLLAALTLAVLASLLPRATSHEELLHLLLQVLEYLRKRPCHCKQLQRAAFFSPTKVAVSSNNSDASQP
ncbi:hypothetical protein CR513_53891, partial [Mucuna pruriens]